MICPDLNPVGVSRPKTDYPTASVAENEEAIKPDLAHYEEPSKMKNILRLGYLYFKQIF